jgi:hypothetical protein
MLQLIDPNTETYFCNCPFAFFIDGREREVKAFVRNKHNQTLHPKRFFQEIHTLS